MKTLKNLILSILAFTPIFLIGQNPIELGKVQWLRQYDAALQASVQQNKPIFVLFQEVPGCATCQNYGKNVLSHPLIVEAIEDLFIPLAIYNNKGGADKKVLDHFGEPSWNNPVVRMLDAKGENLIPRVSGDYSASGVTESMIYALQRADQEVPTYLQLLRDELQAKKEGTRKATFAMYCFWTGEKSYGQLDGVVSTRAGFMDGHEVVEVEYSPTITNLESLIKVGKKTNCADKLYTHTRGQAPVATKALGAQQVATAKTFRLDREPKYYLSK